MFLQTNNITDIDSLHNKIGAMQNRQRDVSNKLNPLERRLKVLDKHIQQAEYGLIVIFGI
jgi:peptidoglycan hydrolase CwlO-like protein